METDDSFIIEKMGEEQTNKNGLLQQEDMGDGLLNKKAEVCVEEKETFKEMFALLRDWAFMMFAISNFLTASPSTLTRRDPLSQGSRFVVLALGHLSLHPSLKCFSPMLRAIGRAFFISWVPSVP